MPGPARPARRVELATGVLRVDVREGAFHLDQLCGFAARNNRKRGFLFLSKVLGKHWPARPSAMAGLHRHLASALDLGPGPWLVIALAETATGLGQGVFEALLERHPDRPALFLHSTRYQLEGRPRLAFEESHCHAPQHYLYEPLTPEHQRLFHGARELILVDDEISTGNTLGNLARAYRARNPGLARVHCLAITNFSEPGCAARFTAHIGVPTRCVAALRGHFSFTPREGETPTPPAAVGDARCEPGRVAEHLGRFGIHRPLTPPPEDLGALAAGLPAGAPVLVLGTGEFMHPAFRVGLSLEARGFQVAVQATTRSPILLGADVRRRLVFPDNYQEGIPNYLYNVDPRGYARIILCHETPAEDLGELSRQLGPACRTYRYPSTVSL